MAIEVRQLIIKSTLQPTQTGEQAYPQPLDVEQLRRDILEECRRMLLEQRRHERER